MTADREVYAGSIPTRIKVKEKKGDNTIKEFY
jgi:hypothetical protein